MASIDSAAGTTVTRIHLICIQRDVTVTSINEIGITPQPGDWGTC
jgi:hypothetical protein